MSILTSFLRLIKPQTTDEITQTIADLASNFDLLEYMGIKQGTLADRPPAGTAKRMYLAEDDPNGPTIYRDNGTRWVAISGGGATGSLGDRVFHENDQEVSASYTLTAGRNAMTAGPITINDGVTVTIPDGAVWTVV